MNRLVLYSGGLQSFYVAYLLRERNNVKLIFCDTATEDADLYRFVVESARVLGLPLEQLKDGRNVWQVFEDVSFMGNNRIDPCSRVLKREMFKSYLIREFPDPTNVRLYYGIGFTEAHRAKRLRRLWAPYRVRTPLIPARTMPQDIYKALRELGVKPPQLYKLGFPHNNCGGFCVKTGQAQFQLLLEKLPERYAWHEAQQERLFARIGQKGFIRKTVNGQLHYLSMKQFREFVESGGDVDKYDFGGCGCFVDDDDE